MTAELDASERRAELSANLEQARADIALACSAVGRQPGEVELVAVTKNFPASDVCHLAALGVRDVGENRDQEAAAKAAEVADAGWHPRWHFVGRLQRNKARSVARYASVVQSVDRPALVTALDAAAVERESPLRVLLQLSLDGDAARGGVVADDDEALAVAVLAAPHLRLDGVMAVAPLNAPPDAAFAALAERAARLRKVAPEATVISAGMTADFPAAIACGATMIRLGAKLLGPRRDVRYPVG